jgi:hypothetical protein
VFNESSYWPLASGLVAYNGVFFMGFMNFLLSLGLALVAAAGWIALRRRQFLLIRITGGALAAAAIFFCHIFGVILFTLLITAHEASLLWKRLRLGLLRVNDVAAAAGAVAAASSPALVLYLLSPLQTQAASPGEWQGLSKLWRIFAPFMTTSAQLTLATAITVVALLILFRRQLQFAPGLALALAALLIAFIAAPSTLKGGTMVDLRFAVMAGLLLFAGIRPRIPSRDAVFAGIVIGTLIVLRSSYIGMTWVDHRRDLADVRAAIADVPPGARVLAARGEPGNVITTDPAERSLPAVYRLDGHLAALLLIERRAFWPLLFADPAQQPVIIKPPFDRIAQPLSEPAEWPWLAQDPLPPEALLRARYLDHWQQNFDEVLLVDAPGTAQAASALSLHYRGKYAQLYRIDHASRRDERE